MLIPRNLRDGVEILFVWWKMNDEKLVPMSLAYPDSFWTGIVRPKIGPCFISKQFNSQLVNACNKWLESFVFMNLILLNVLAKWSCKKAVLKICVRFVYQYTRTVQSAIILFAFIR